MTEVIYGTKEFLDKIDITDPCYDKMTWCRINDFKIPAGTYECYTHEASNEETRGWGKRVARIGIRRGSADRYVEIGSIGVDAGLAGFFNDKPDYTDNEWLEFVDRVDKGRAWIIDDGFYSESGYGDGGYPVYAGYKNGVLVEIYIDFIQEEEE